MRCCAVSGCTQEVQARGYCNTHYWRWNMYGDASYEGPRNRASRLRAEARSKGEKTYFTGLECGGGHIAERMTNTGKCIECNREAWREKYRRDPERVLAATKRWSAKNSEKHREAIRKWDALNRPRKNEHAARRRAAQLRATPSWADADAIRAIYQKAYEMGMHVDHIVPLQGKTVCGLHVENNLQLLEPRANLRKSNKLLMNAAGTTV
jgi:hypothetical protein